MPRRGDSGSEAAGGLGPQSLEGGWFSNSPVKASARFGNHRLLKCFVVLYVAFNFPSKNTGSHSIAKQTCGDNTRTRFPLLFLYWFSTAAITNHHKLRGLKQHKFIALCISLG